MALSSSTPDRDRALAPAFAAEFRERILESDEPVTLTVHRAIAWSIMGTLQAGLRGADYRSPSAQMAHRATEQLMDELAPDGPLREMASKGWAD